MFSLLLKLSNSLFGNAQWYNLFKKRVNKYISSPWELEKTQQMLSAYIAQQNYGSLASNRNFHSEINKFEFKVFSQNGEDGILLHLFSKIGTTDCRFVEFGFGDGSECCTANLSINFGWRGLLMDANCRDIELAQAFYQKKLGNNFSGMTILERLVTSENINSLLLDNGMKGEIDLLSVDIDGNDYWVWKAITAVNPRVVVIEYNASFGDTRSLAVKYHPTLDRFKDNPHGYYHSASLAAINALAKSKGYVLVGCDSNGINAFFVREDLAPGSFEEVPVQKAYFPHSRRTQGMTPEEQFESIQHMKFEAV